MMRELLILRHGKAHPQEDADDDKTRELKDKGKRNAQRVGVWLAQNGLLPDHVISSHATRAKRTAEKCCKSAGLDGSMVYKDARVYEATLTNLLDVLRETPDDRSRVLLVGHNPSLEALLVHLSRAPVPRNEKDGFLVTGALAHLRFQGGWKDLRQHCAELLDVIEPGALPRLFPYPDIHGAEERARPAYYYTQSSVVPFRRTDAGLEVLIISSSKRRHWVIPKGIHDPGRTAQDSAAKEAFEEAGVEGRVLSNLIGTYSYEKWDATCDVEVYPMEVTRELPEGEWVESHRGRKWVSVEEAASLVLNDDVKRIITNLPDVLAKEEA